MFRGKLEPKFRDSQFQVLPRAVWSDPPRTKTHNNIRNVEHTGIFTVVSQYRYGMPSYPKDVPPTVQHSEPLECIRRGGETHSCVNARSASVFG